MEIDRISVITLERTPDRFATFVARNAHLPLERFVGTDGETLDRWDLVDQGLVTAGNPYAIGSLGSATSHIRLWKRCAKARRAVHVAEDDAIFRGDFLQTAATTLGGLGDWDFVQWGWNFDWPLELRLGDGLGTAVVACDQDALRAGWPAFPSAQEMPRLFRLVSNTGLCAYSLSPRGADRLLERCLPLAGAPARYPGKDGQSLLNRTLDVEMTRHYTSLQAYICLPCLAISLNHKRGSSESGVQLPI